MSLSLINEDCLVRLKTMQSESLHALITDPPAGISFMGKDWDKDKGGRDHWIAWFSDVMRECLRVLTPGAHGLIWALPRTSHWTATALENAGFEIRDIVNHIFGSGFPKSHDVSKAIDKINQAKREIIGISENDRPSKEIGAAAIFHKARHEGKGHEPFFVTAPASDDAKQWEGWGTALKPAHEHWILVRKPISEKTVAANVLKHGTGGINIDGCRIEFKSDKDFQSATFGTQPKITSKGIGLEGGTFQGYNQGINATNVEANKLGRFPANLILSEDAAKELDEHSLANGMHSAGSKIDNNYVGNTGSKNINIGGGITANRFGDSGGASRFFT